MAHSGSRDCACRNERAASLWLNPKDRISPWSKNFWASGEAVETGCAVTAQALQNRSDGLIARLRGCGAQAQE